MFNNGLRNKYISQWDVDDVIRWLNDLNLSTYACLFESHNLNGYDLCFLTSESLISYIKINKLHDRNLMLQSIRRHLLDELVITIIYGEHTFNIQLDLDIDFNIDKLSNIVKELFQFNDNRFFFRYTERVTILSSCCKIVENVLNDPSKYKVIYVIRDTKPLLTLNTERCVRSTVEEFSNRDPRERKTVSVDEKENPKFQKNEILDLNISQVKQIKPFVSKENNNSKNEDNKSFNLQLEKISESSSKKKNEIIERTNIYFNNLKSRVNPNNGEFNKTFIENKLNNSTFNFQGPSNRYSSEVKMNKDKEREFLYKSAIEIKYPLNISNENIKMVDEKDKPYSNLKIRDNRKKDDKYEDKTLNEKDKSKNSSKTYLKYSSSKKFNGK